jgi:2-polyprenyl-3-methyl-5-hydroxy-6-metoxy-1,4-benzoquinol methylase
VGAAAAERAMSYRKRLVERYWSTHHRRFEPATVEEWDGVLDRIEANLGTFFATLPRDARILDVPCGVGYLEAYLLRRGFTNIRAVDLSEEQLQVARERLHERELVTEGRVEFRSADAFELLQDGTSYQVIAVLDFLEHLPKAEIIRMLDLCHQALVPGGLLFLRVSNAENPMWGAMFHRDFTHETPFTIASLQQCLDVTAFELLRIAYEVVPAAGGGSPTLYVKQRIVSAGRAVLCRFLGVPPGAFAEDLVAVARRP